MSIDLQKPIINLEQKDESKTVQVVPVEQLISEIRPQQVRKVGKVENIDYQTETFDDSFVLEFFKDSLLHIFRNYIDYQDDPISDFSILRERMKDQVIVDLGASDTSLGYELASLLGAKAYIGVDIRSDAVRRYEDELRGLTSSENRTRMIDFLKRKSSAYSEGFLQSEEIEKTIDSAMGTEMIPASIIQDDFLSFLKRLPDDSVSVFTFGIDSNIIPDEGYRQEISREIQRVLSQKGAYLTYTSDIPKGELVNPFRELNKKVQALRTQFRGGLFADFFVKEISLAEKGEPERSLTEIYLKLPKNIQQQLRDHANNFLGFRTAGTGGFLKRFELSKESEEAYGGDLLMKRYLERVNNLVDQGSFALFKENPPNPERIKELEEEIMQTFYGIQGWDEIKLRNKN
jgi:hypothetical protein